MHFANCTLKINRTLNLFDKHCSFKLFLQNKKETIHKRIISFYKIDLEEFYYLTIVISSIKFVAPAYLSMIKST